MSRSTVIRVANDQTTFSAAETQPGASSPAASGKTVNRQRRHDDRPDVWHLMHRALRGRYRLALSLAIGGAVAGGGIGFTSGRRLYKATGLVRIAAARGAVMKETDQNRSLPMFDGYIQAQGEVMSSRETVQAAMQDPNWSAAAKRHRAVSDEQFAESLKVETRHGSDHLHVTYTDPDPRIAAAAVRSVITVFQRGYERDEARSEQQRIDELQSRRAAIGSELKGVEKEMGPLGSAPEGPAAAIDPSYEAAAGRLKKFRAALVDVQCAIAGNPLPSERTPGQPASPGESVASTLLSAYATEEARDEMELNRLIQLGYGPSHPMVLRVRAAERAAHDQIARCEQSVEEARKANVKPASPAELKEQAATLLRLSASAEDEMKQLAAQRSRLLALAQRANELRQSLSEVESRIDVLNTEASMGSRLTVVSGGDKPMTALLDSRPRAAALGAAAGGAAPIVLLICLAGMRRRYRNPIELAEDLATRVPFVAVLPSVDPTLAAAEEAARAVHQLRVRLQPPSGSPCQAYLVTSPEARDGKSGIAMALGLSFAAAGYRTLLIDGDLSTRRLTLGLKAQDEPGFRNAADGREPAIRSLRAGLCFMPSGRGRQEDQYTLPPGHVTRLLHKLRQQFDIILIDSNPLLTGVASVAIANQVDGVLFNVTQNQSHSAVREGLRLLEQQRATVAGCVFNRDGKLEAALPKVAAAVAAPPVPPAPPVSPTPAPTRPYGRRALDLQQNRAATAARRTPSAPTAQAAAPTAETPAARSAAEPPAAAPTLSDRLRAFGPLVAAVMTSLAVSEDENLALIDPPASAPKVTIFPQAPAIVGSDRRYVA